MQFCGSIFAQLLKPIDRRRFAERVERLGADAYDKSFKSWDHLVALIHGQLGGATSLRGLAAGFNANAQHHYHLGTGPVARSTLSDANARRPTGVFAETFNDLAALADRRVRREGEEMVRLIDSSPIPVAKLCRWATWNGRIRGLKMHVVYDPNSDVPMSLEITPAVVNDVEIGRQTRIEAGAAYVFDKGYYNFAWFAQIHATQAFFVTRPKSLTRWRTTKLRPVGTIAGGYAGFRVIEDAEVALASKGDSRLAMPLRRIRIRRDDGTAFTLITNAMQRSAGEIGRLYKGRWQIELLFRWIKQNLRIRRFIATNENAIALQILAAMIAYLLLRIAQRINSLSAMPALRLAQLIGQFLFTRKPIAQIDKPPPVNPSKPQPRSHPDQLELLHA